MLCKFLLYNVNQPYAYIYPLLLQRPSHTPSHPSRSSRSWAPCAIQQVPTSYLFYTLVYVSMLFSQFLPFSPSPAGSRSPFSLSGPLFPQWSLDFKWTNTNRQALIKLSREGNGTPREYSCLENPMEGGAWWTTVHGVAKVQPGLSYFTLKFHFHALEKEMATHSSILAWRIPGTGEPGGLLSMGLLRVGHDWSDLAAVASNFLLGSCLLMLH